MRCHSDFSAALFFLISFARQRLAALSACLMLSVVHSTVSAQPLPDDGIGGTVLGQVVTVAGQDFYQGFVTLWRDKLMSERYQLVIRERASARTGSIVWIETQGRRVLQLSLPGSRSLIRRVSEQAVEETWQRLTEAELDARLNGERDLAKDEL